MLALSAAITLALVADAKVILRGRDAAAVTGVTSIDATGVRAGEGPAARLIPWHDVARIEGEFADEAVPWIDQGDRLWRGLRRLDRGDLPSAEALLEGLGGPISQTRGPTAAAIWRGLLRCRLERGAQAAAAAAWLAWLGVGGAVYETSSARQSPGTLAGIDDTGLLASLPPIWVDVPSVAVIAAARQEPWVVDPQRSADTVEQLRAWYIQAARGACGRLSTVPGGEATHWPEASDEKSVQIVSAVVLAQYGDSSQRLAARGKLKAMAEDRRGTWLEAWCRVAVGRSMTRETDPEIRRLGVVELLHVPARLENTVPYLTGVALADAAVALRDLGDLAGATRLREELVRRFGGHPAVEWSAVRDWPAHAGSSSNVGQPSEPRESQEQR